MDKSLHLAASYFTKEFQGFEVEAKFDVLSFNPVALLASLLDDINSGHWNNYRPANQMGHLPTGIRYFDTEFILVGQERDSAIQQIAQIVRHPSRPRYVVAFKSEAPEISLPSIDIIPLIRSESRDGRWLAKDKVVGMFSNVSKPLYCGMFRREKAFIYITSSSTQRNFSLSVDYCASNGNFLSQIEIEYKGRNGIWSEDKLGLMFEFHYLGEIIARKYGKAFKPSTQTKFEWLRSFSPAPEQLSNLHL